MRTIAEDTGREVSELFSEFDPTPLGSASIGQVHRARLRSDGTYCLSGSSGDALHVPQGDPLLERTQLVRVLALQRS